MRMISIKGLLALFLALIAAGGGGMLVYAWQGGHLAKPQTAKSDAAPATPPAPTASAAPAAPVGLAAVQTQANAIVSALAGPPPAPDVAEGAPSFDIARIEPTGEAVVAGRATPGATVELLRDGQVHDRVVADAAGQFAMVPPRLPSGTYNLTLRAKAKDGKEATSKQSVAVAFEPRPNERPVVALMAPDKPTVVMSQPAAPKQAAGAVVVETAEIERGGKFHLTGRARPGAALRFYLNDSFIAPVTAAADGRFAITINEGMTPGNYRIRLDEVEPKSGAVQARAEVPFTAPDSMVTASVTARPADVKPAAAALKAAAPAVQASAAAASSATAAGAPAGAASPELAAATTTVQPSSLPAAAATAPSEQATTTTIVSSAQPVTATVVPKVVTTTVTRGDSLWRISQLTYGAGIRYAVIYKANQTQIRDPDLIYPGQIFVLPTE